MSLGPRVHPHWCSKCIQIWTLHIFMLWRSFDGAHSPSLQVKFILITCTGSCMVGYPEDRYQWMKLSATYINASSWGHYYSRILYIHTIDWYVSIYLVFLSFLYIILVLHPNYYVNTSAADHFTTRLYMRLPSGSALGKWGPYDPWRFLRDRCACWVLTK